MADKTNTGPFKRSRDDEQFVGIVVTFFKLVGLMSVVWVLGYFQFSITWIIIGLMVYTFNAHFKKMKNKQMRMAHDAAVDEQKSVLARVEDLPSWVFFPDVERAEWVNKVIAQMWPFIGDYVEDLLKNSVEEKLKGSLPASMKSFKFERIDLGDVAPRIGGVKCYVDCVRRDEIVLDMEIFYAGDADIRVAVGRGKAGIKDVQVHGTLRVIFKPLMPKMPLIGGLQIFFLRKPSIDFNLTDLANAFDIPGLSDTLHTIICDQVAAMMVLPNRYPVQLSGDINYADLKYPVPTGVLRINVVQAKNLKASDINVFGKNSSDPYVQIYVGSQSYRTKTINKNLNPSWNAFYEAVVDQKTGQHLDLEVYDDDDASKDDNLGSVSVDIGSIADKGMVDRWLPLEEADEGQLRLKLMWLNLSSDPQDLQKVEKVNDKWRTFTRKEYAVHEDDSSVEDIGSMFFGCIPPLASSVEQSKSMGSAEPLSTALLMVYLDSASDLPTHRRSMTSEPSPYCMLKIGNDQKQSRVEASSAHPRWEQNFQFLIQSPTLEDLEIEVFDKKKGKKLGWCTLSIKQLLGEPSMCIYEPVALKHAGPKSMIVVRMCLRILTTDAATNSSLLSTLVPSPVTELATTDATTEQPKQEEAVPSTDAVDSNDNMSEKAYVENIESDSGSNTPTMLERVGSELRKRPTHSQMGSEGAGEGLGQIQVTIRYSSQRSRLICVVHKCRNLMPIDDEGLADPYVRLYLLPDKSLHGKKKTQVVKNNLSPTFDETFEFAVNQKDAEERSLDIAVKNQVNWFSKEKTDMGRFTIELASIDLNKAVTKWYDLRSADDMKTASRNSSFMTTV